MKATILICVNVCRIETAPVSGMNDTVLCAWVGQANITEAS